MIQVAEMHWILNHMVVVQQTILQMTGLLILFWIDNFSAFIYYIHIQSVAILISALPTSLSEIMDIEVSQDARHM